MILDKLKELIVNIVPLVDPDTITEDTRLIEDLGLNSMTMMLVAMSIENEFDIEFIDAPEFYNVADVISFIQGKLA